MMESLPDRKLFQLRLPRLRLRMQPRKFRGRCAVSSVVEHHLDTVGVRGSKPLPRTILTTLGFARQCAGVPAARRLFEFALHRLIGQDGSMKALLLSALLLTGCAGISSTGSRVETVSFPPPGGRFVAAIQESSPLAGLFKDSSYQSALNKALNRAGQLGATHFVLDPDQGPRYWGVNQTVRGRAYKSAPH
jgi:hypothetical protein